VFETLQCSFRLRDGEIRARHATPRHGGERRGRRGSGRIEAIERDEFELTKYFDLSSAEMDVVVTTGEEEEGTDGGKGGGRDGGTKIHWRLLLTSMLIRVSID
jgi:hypothetical protein